MADLIKIKGGSGNVPSLQERELAYRKDEKALYIGTNNGNERLCGAGDINALSTRIDALSKLIEEITARLDALTPNG